MNHLVTLTAIIACGFIFWATNQAFMTAWDANNWKHIVGLGICKISATVVGGYGVLRLFRAGRSVLEHARPKKRQQASTTTREFWKRGNRHESGAITKNTLVWIFAIAMWVLGAYLYVSTRDMRQGRYNLPPVGQPQQQQTWKEIP